jgi:predicted DNA-binding transcriptional regulator AlpA
MNDMKLVRLLNAAPQVLSSVSGLRHRVARKEFPKPIATGHRSCGYFEHELQQMITAYAKGFDSEQLKQLSRKIEAQRLELTTGETVQSSSPL